MAVTTFTASEVTPLKRLHAGLNVARAEFLNVNAASTPTFTISSVIFMIKLPNGAILTDGYLSGGNANGDEGTWNVGIRRGDGTVAPYPVNALTGATVSDNSLLAAVTLSDGFVRRFGETGAAQLALPYKVSCSDGDINQFQWLVVTAVTGSGTQTNSLHMVAYYLGNETG